MKPLVIEACAAAAMHGHAEAGYPYEVVGILAGRGGVVTQVEALVNERSDSPANRYLVSGLALMRAERRLEAGGLEIFGYYHSHPDHSAAYSDFDREHALPTLSYVIVSVRQGVVADTLCWRLREDRTVMDPQHVTIEEPEL